MSIGRNSQNSKTIYAEAYKQSCLKQFDKIFMFAVTNFTSIMIAFLKSQIAGLI